MSLPGPPPGIAGGELSLDLDRTIPKLDDAHLLVQVRAKALNRELPKFFVRWYPHLNLEADQASNAVPLKEVA